MDACAASYDDLIPEIFQKNPFSGPIKLTTQQAFYDDKHWEKVLQRLGGEQRMVDSMSAEDAMAVGWWSW
jgi:hypothetical protein